MQTSSLHTQQWALQTGLSALSFQLWMFRFGSPFSNKTAYLKKKKSRWLLTFLVYSLWWQIATGHIPNLNTGFFKVPQIWTDGWGVFSQAIIPFYRHFYILHYSPWAFFTLLCEHCDSLRSYPVECPSLRPLNKGQRHCSLMPWTLEKSKWMLEPWENVSLCSKVAQENNLAKGLKNSEKNWLIPLYVQVKCLCGDTLCIFGKAHNAHWVEPNGFLKAIKGH